MSDNSASGRSLGLVVGVVLAVAVAVAAIVTSLRPSPQLDPNTPEGTVQAFFQAVEADDWEGLRAFCRVLCRSNASPPSWRSSVTTSIGP